MKKILSIAVLAIATMHLIYLIDAWSKYNQFSNIFSNSITNEAKKYYFFGFAFDAIIILAAIFGLISSFNDEKISENARRKEAERDWERKQTDYRAPIKIIKSIKRDENKFNGDRKIEDDSYKLYLVSKYKVTKNDVFNKFVYKDKMYDSIEELLIILDEQEKSSMNSTDRINTIDNSIHEGISHYTSEEYGITAVKSKLSQLGYLIEETQNSSGNRKFTLTKSGKTEYLYSTDELIRFYNATATWNIQQSYFKYYWL